jgi:hypothetical protein
VLSIALTVGGYSDLIDDDRWLLGPNNVSAGSLHCDVWSGPAIELLGRDTLCIKPVNGWWRDRVGREHVNKHTRYSLIVTLNGRRSVRPHEDSGGHSGDGNRNSDLTASAQAGVQSASSSTWRCGPSAAVGVGEIGKLHRARPVCASLIRMTLFRAKGEMGVVVKKEGVDTVAG